MSNATLNSYDCFIHNIQQWANEHNIDANAARYEPLPEPIDQAFLGQEYDFAPESYIDKAWLTSMDDAMKNLERGTVVVGNVGHATAAATGTQVHHGVDPRGQASFYGQHAFTGSNILDITAPFNVPSASGSSAPAGAAGDSETTPFQFGTGTTASFSYTFTAPSEVDGAVLATHSNGRDAGLEQGTMLLDRTNAPPAKRRRKGAVPSQNIHQATASSAEAGCAIAAGSSTHHGLGPHAQSNQNILPRNTAHAFERLSLGQWAILLHLHPFDADPGAEDTRYEAQSGSKNPKAKTQSSATHTLECSTCRAQGTPTYHQDRAALKRHTKTHKPVRHFRCTMCAAIVLDRPDRVTEHWGGKCKAYAKLREKGIAWYWAALYGMFNHAQFAGREYLWE